MTEAELKKMTVKQLRVLASEKTDLAGLSGMKKDALVVALVEKLGVTKEVKKAGTDALKNKQAAKNEIKRLKQKKQEFLQEKTLNKKQMRNIRRRVRRLKKNLRKVS